MSENINLNKRDLIRPIYAEIPLRTYRRLKKLCLEMDKDMREILAKMIEDSYESWEKAKKGIKSDD